MKLSSALVVLCALVACPAMANIECFECTQCADPLKSETTPKTRGTYCVKEKIQYENGTQIVGRYADDWGGLPFKDCFTGAVQGHQYYLCFCDTNLCNGAHRTHTILTGCKTGLLAMMIVLLLLTRNT